MPGGVCIGLGVCIAAVCAPGCGVFGTCAKTSVPGALTIIAVAAARTLAAAIEPAAIGDVGDRRLAERRG